MQHHGDGFLKGIFTVVTLSAGFEGGEVAPLFFIGAALGNALVGLLGAPIDLFAALGFVAVLAGAADTPLACTSMGIERFGAGHAVPIAVAYFCWGHSGIYLLQRIANQAWKNSPGTYRLLLASDAVAIVASAPVRLSNAD